MPEVSHPLPAFAAALLCGGQSRRMGRDKAWLDWEGAPLWQVQLNKLADLGPTRLLISCREAQGIHDDGAELVLDPPGNAGPLPALARCLERVQMPLMVLGVDMPRMSLDLLQYLAARGLETTQGIICRRGEYHEPLCAVYPPNVLPLLQAAMEEENFRLQSFAQNAVRAGLLREMALAPEREACFLNVNTPDDIPPHG